MLSKYHIVSLALLSLPLAAQQDVVLDIDPALSTWTWSGTTDLGPVEATNSNQFVMSGTTELRITPGSEPISTGQLTGNGVAAVMPDLSGLVPNPISFLPPVATIDVTNLTLGYSSPPFAVDAAGNFTTMLTVTTLSGTVDVVPLVGTPTSTDLSGTVADPTLLSGNVSHASGVITFDSPQNTPFSFTDPGSGISGSFTLIGTIHADWSCPAAVTYCTAKTNSLGCVPQIGVSGSYVSYSDPSAYEVVATNVLNVKPGFFFYGLNGPAAISFQGGTLCLTPPLRRTPLLFSGGAPPEACTGQYTFDLNAWIQTGNDPFLEPGAQVQGQFWSRDQNSSNGTGLTDAVEAVVCP